MLTQLEALDKSLFLLLNSRLFHPLLDTVFVHITTPTFWIIPGLIAASFFVWEKKLQALIILGLMILAVGLADAVCNQIIKHAVERLRPCNPLALVEGGRFLMGHKTSFSFPSSHAMNMFTAAMVLACFYRKQWPWFFGFAALIGYSRIYVGVHYPADVAAGALFGIATGALVFALFSLIKNSVEGRTASKGPKPNAPETGTAP